LDWIAKGLSASDAMKKTRKAGPSAVETPDHVAVLEEFAKIR
jgi:hypothetical protein